MKNTSAPEKFRKTYNLPYLLGVYLAANAVPDAGAALFFAPSRQRLTNYSHFQNRLKNCFDSRRYGSRLKVTCRGEQMPRLGRPKVAERKVKFTTFLRPSLIAIIEAEAEKDKRKPSQFIGVLLEQHFTK